MRERSEAERKGMVSWKRRGSPNWARRNYLFLNRCALALSPGLIERFEMKRTTEGHFVPLDTGIRNQEG